MPPRKAQSSQTATSKPPPETTSSYAQLQADPNPPQLLILPENTPTSARFVSLKNPSTSRLNRYLYCPDTGFYEFTQVGSSSKAPRSILLEQEQRGEDYTGTATTARAEGTGTDKHGSDKEAGRSQAHYALQDPTLLVATPYDETFFLTLLWPSCTSTHDRTEGRPMARLSEDYLDSLAGTADHMAQLLKRADVRRRFEDSLRNICKVQDAGGETLYRLDALTLLELLHQKAEAAAKPGHWPPSLENHARKMLETPATATSLRQRQSEHTGQDLQTKSGGDGKADGHDRTEETLDSPWTAVPCGNSQRVLQKFRTRIALDFMLSSYVLPELRKHLQGMIATNKTRDFRDLDAHLEKSRQAKEEAQALRTLSENVSRKRGMEGDGAAAARAEKVRRKEEEEKKNKTESRGTKELKKVDKSGMRKLSSFFSRKNVQ